MKRAVTCGGRGTCGTENFARSAKCVTITEKCICFDVLFVGSVRLLLFSGGVRTRKQQKPLLKQQFAQSSKDFVHFPSFIRPLLLIAYPSSILSDFWFQKVPKIFALKHLFKGMCSNSDN